MSHDPRHVTYLMLVAVTAMAPLPSAADTMIASRTIVAQAETPPPEGESANEKKQKKSEEREQKRQKSERNQNSKNNNLQQQDRAVQQGQPSGEGNAKKQQNENRKAQQQQFQEQQRQKKEAEQQQRQMQREQQKVKQEQFKEQQRQKQEADQKQRQLQREQQKAQQEQFKEQQRLKREADQKQKQLEYEQKKALQDQAKEQQRQRLEAEQQQKKLEKEQKTLAKDPPQQPPPNQPGNTREANPNTAPANQVVPPPNPPAAQAGDPNFSKRKFDRAQREEIRKSYRREARQQRSFDDLKKNRKERTIADGKLRVIEEPDRRIIVKQDNRTFIRHDESERFRRIAPDARTIRRADGTSTTFMTRSGGIRIYDVTDRNGRLLYRYRRYPDGREVILIDNRRYYRRENNRTRDILIGAGIGLVVGSAIALATPDVRIPRDRYIVDYGRASDDDLYEALTAPPVERLDRGYSLEEIRYSAPLRDRMRRIDLDTVTFDFGSWEVGPDQARALDRLAEGINRMLERNPDEIVMIEGHTDAVGSQEDNLTLSDRRAQSVAEILTTDYGVPPENLVTQGYGEEQLKIPTDGPERANRRITVRRIGPLLSGQFDGDRTSGPADDRDGEPYDRR